MQLPRRRAGPQPGHDDSGGAVMRQMRSWSLTRRLFRLPAWAAALAGTFVLGAVAGPIAASAQPAQGARAGHSGRMNHIFVIMMENTQYRALLSPANRNTRFI